MAHDEPAGHRNYLWFCRGDAVLAARRLQLPPPDPLAQALAAPIPDGTLPAAVDQSSLKLGFFTDDQINLASIGKRSSAP